MSRGTFSAKDKEAAVKLMMDGSMTQKQIAKKFGCSIASLQQWKRALDIQPAQGEWEEEWEEDGDEAAPQETATQVPTPQETKKAKSTPSPKKGTADDFVKQFWGKNGRAVNMLFAQQGISQEEAFKLVNDALQYGYEHSQK